MIPKLCCKEYDLTRLDENNILIKPVRASDIINIIKGFKNKAPGISGINKQILSQLPPNAIERYSVLTNLTLSMGYYPTAYKNGELIFTPKQGKDPRLPENYSPITLLEVPGKILECIINDRFMHFCETNNISSQQQFGFRKRKGTNKAIAIAYKTIAVNQQHKNHCNIICRGCGKGLRSCLDQRLKIQNIKFRRSAYTAKESNMQFYNQQNCTNKDRLSNRNKIPIESRSPSGKYSLSLSFHILYS